MYLNLFLIFVRKTSSIDSNQVHVRGKRFKSDSDSSILEESTLKLPPIISKYPNQQSFIKMNESDEKGNDKLKQNSSDNNNMNNNDVDDDDDNGSEENVITGIEHSLSFNTPVKVSMESIDKLPFITGNLYTLIIIILLDFILNVLYFW